MNLSPLNVTETCEIYVDENGCKVVEPVYNGGGGTASGRICVVKRAA